MPVQRNVRDHGLSDHTDGQWCDVTEVCVRCNPAPAATAYFVTMARDQEVVDRYLYSTAGVVQVLPSERPGVGVFLIEVTGTTESDALTRASNQAARLNSGIYPTTPIYLGRESAVVMATENGWTA